MIPSASRRHPSYARQPTLLPRQGHFSNTNASATASQHKGERGRKNVSRACQECRQRRIKCTNERPCQPCQGNDLHCTDDSGPEGIDLRTIRMGQNSHRQLLRQKALLDKLVQQIRAGEAGAVLERIQAGAALEEIAALLGSGSGSSSASHVPGYVSDQSENADGVISPTNIEKGRAVLNRRSRQSDNTTAFGNLPLSSAVRANHFSSSVQHRQVGNLSRPIWECLPLINEDLSAADAFSRSIFSFWSLARQQIADGVSSDLVLSSNGIEVDLLFRDRIVEDPHTVSTWACELLKTFTFLPPVVKMAATEAIACLMRWLVAPTREHYEALPDSSRPIESQLFVPHSIGVDIIYLPEIRDSLLTRVGRDWVSNVRPTTLNYHWPYSDEACLEQSPISQDGSVSPVRLSKAFLEHIRNRSNVSIDRRMLNVFPEFEGTVRLHDSFAPQYMEDFTEVDGDDTTDAAG